MISFFEYGIRKLLTVIPKKTNVYYNFKLQLKINFDQNKNQIGYHP